MAADHPNCFVVPYRKKKARPTLAGSYAGQRQSFERFDLLTPLRGVAAFAVLILHVVVGTAGNPVSGPISSWLRCVTDFGALGVDLFFVISGYCISNSAVSFVQRGRSAVMFWLDRCVRVLPVFWVALGFAILSSAFVDLMMGRVVGSALSGGWQEWLGHVFLVDVFLGLPPGMDVTWTLSHELVFYALSGVTILIARFPGGKLVWLLIVLIVVIASICGWNSGRFLSLRFLPEFMCGVAVYFASFRPQFTWPIIAGLLTLASVYWLGAHFHETHHGHLMVFQLGELPVRMSVAALCGCLLILLQPYDWMISRLSFVSPFHFLGTISFSLYLIHVPVSRPVANGLAKVLPSNPFCGIFLIFCTVMVALVGGWLLHKFVETPIETWRRAYFSKRL